jgi:hypothetical protein
MEPQYFQIDPASVFQATARSKRSGRKKLEKTESIYLAVARHIARAKGFHAGDVVTLGVIAITPQNNEETKDNRASEIQSPALEYVLSLDPPTSRAEKKKQSHSIPRKKKGERSTRPARKQSK